MKFFSIPALTLTLLTVGAAQAAEVVAETGDTTAGGAAGVVSGMMVGAVGGPIGALVGAGVGMFAGKSVQKGAGLEGRAYRVRKDNGEEVEVRSPNATFAPGEKVAIQGGRLYAPTESVSSR